MVKTGNLRRDLPARPLPDEAVDLLVERPGLRIERIVSTGQATPEGRMARPGDRRVGACRRGRGALTHRG